MARLALLTSSRDGVRVRHQGDGDGETMPRFESNAGPRLFRRRSISKSRLSDSPAAFACSGQPPTALRTEGAHAPPFCVSSSSLWPCLFVHTKTLLDGISNLHRSRQELGRRTRDRRPSSRVERPHRRSASRKIETKSLRKLRVFPKTGCGGKVRMRKHAGGSSTRPPQRPAA